MSKDKLQPITTTQLPSIFLSYARVDDEDGFVKALYDELVQQNFTVWWDKVSMPSRGLTFLHEIAHAIDVSDRVLLVLSPTAAKSEYVRAEWQYALVSDKIVTPVLRGGEFALLPPELKGSHCEDARARRDPREAFDAVLRLAKAAPPALASVETVPIAPPHYRPRPDQLTRVAEKLALERPEQLAVPAEKRTFLVHGMGGVGKSVLAAGVARSTATRRVFSNGVIWVPVGPDAQPLAVLQQIARGLGDDLARYDTEQTARAQLHERLRNAAVLIILDNIWSKTAVEPVREALGPRCRLLITAREPGVMDTGTPLVDLEPFSPDEAIAYLADRARAESREVAPEIAEVARECGYLPFALALAGTMIASTSWERLLQRLKAADLKFMEAKIPGYPYTTLLRALQVSIDHLREPDDADGREADGARGRDAVARYLEIAAFRWEAGVPEAALLTLWRARGLDEFAGEDVLTLLARHGLVRTEGQAPARLVRLHDLQQDYLWAHVADRSRAHASILDAYARCFPAAPMVAHDDGYYLDNFFHHLEQANRASDMHAILDREDAEGHNAWWATRIAHGQVMGFVSDVRRAWASAWSGVLDGHPPTVDVVARSARYALMIGSARAAVSDVPLALVSQLLDRKLWNANQAIAVLEWAGHGNGLLDSFAAVYPHLPLTRQREAIEEALQRARGQAELQDCSRRLLEIAPFLDAHRRAYVIDEALSLQGAQKTYSLLNALKLTPERSDLLNRAIDAARNETRPFSRKTALQELAPALPADRINEVLPLVSGAGSDEDQAEVLRELAFRIPEKQQEELAARAFELLADGENFKGAGVTAIKARAGIVRLLRASERGAAARGVIGEITRLKWRRHRLAAIADVVLFLEGAERTRAEALAYELARGVTASDIEDFVKEGGRGAWLAQSASAFFQPLLTALLNVARKESDSYKRISAIAALLPLLDDERAREVLKEENQRSQLINDVEARAKCIGALAKLLPEDSRDAIVARMLGAILDRPGHAPSGRDLSALAPVATGDQLDAIVAVLPRIDEFSRGETVCAVFAAYARLGRWKSALDLLPQFDGAWRLKLAIEKLPPQIPEDVARSIIARAVNTQDAEFGAAAIPPLCRHLPDDQYDRTCEVGLEAARTLERYHDRYVLLEKLIPSLPCHRLSAASELIKDDEDEATMERDAALVALARRRGECRELQQAIDTLKRMAYADAGSRACVALSSLDSVPEPLRTTLLERAEEFADVESSYTRVQLLAEIARRRAEPHKTRLVEKALALARGLDESSSYISTEEAKARALTSIAPLLDVKRRSDVVLETWRYAARRGLSGTQPLEALVPLIAELEPGRIAPQWREQLDLSSARRNIVLEELEVLAPVIARLGAKDAVLAVIQAVENVASWWP